MSAERLARAAGVGTRTVALGVGLAIGLVWLVAVLADTRPFAAGMFWALWTSPLTVAAVTLGPLVHRRLPVAARPAVLLVLAIAIGATAQPLLLLALLLGAIYVIGTRMSDDAARVRVPLLTVAALVLVRPVATGAGLPLPVVPLGLAYTGFRLAQVEIERRRGRLELPEPTSFLAWLTFFPIVVAGPIDRIAGWTESLAVNAQRRDLVSGWSRIALGLAKKALLATLFTELAINLRGDRAPGALETGEAWLYAVLLVLEGYTEFSAYSDVAIGTARCFGVKASENFRWPLLATSLPDWWRRWHMTLMRFCQGNVYMPMIGATRNPYLASLATFLVMGLWHHPSASWVAWAVWHATGIAATVAAARAWRARKLPPLPSWFVQTFGRASTLGFICFAAVIARTDGDGLAAGLAMLGRMVGLGGL